jgi:hypothetical protein
MSIGDIGGHGAFFGRGGGWQPQAAKSGSSVANGLTDASGTITRSTGTGNT